MNFEVVSNASRLFFVEATASALDVPHTFIMSSMAFFWFPAQSALQYASTLAFSSFFVLVAAVLINSGELIAHSVLVAVAFAIKAIAVKHSANAPSALSSEVVFCA